MRSVARKLRRPLVWIMASAAPAALWAAAPVPLPGAATASQPLTLEKIMSDPDWIGPPVQGGYWSADDRAVYYSIKRGGSPIVDLHRIDLGDGKDRVVDIGAVASADGPPVYDYADKRAAFIRNGDVFVRDLGSGRLTQITRSLEAMDAPRFSADGRLLTFHAGNDWFVHAFESGVTAPAAVVKAEKDPDAPPKPDDLRDMQMRTFATLKRLHDDAEAVRKEAEELRRGDASRAAAPFYLGDDVVIKRTELSPDARWVMVVTTPKSAEKGREGKLTRYVTESGYEEFETERVRVGRNEPAPQSLLLLDLATHTMHPLSIENLPGIHDDPLKAVRDENAAETRARAVAAPGVAAPNAGAPNAAAPGGAPPQRREVIVVGEEPDPGAGGIVWSRDAKGLAIQLVAEDNKDRWIASVDLARFVLVPQHRLTDPAWINWANNEFGWLRDNRTLWFVSEESGFAHLYVKSPDAAPRALTTGKFEVTEPVLSEDGRWFYVLSNQVAPYSQDVYRVLAAGGALERITQLQGVEHFVPDRGGNRVLVTHSGPYTNSQLALVTAGARGSRELTDTRTPEYRARSWVAPEIVKVPSAHFDGVIYGKLYRAAGGVDAVAHSGPGGAASDGGLHPAVLFIHGAGYLQDVHLRFPYYFREQMFNNLLVQHGYVVLDLDYRASQGYGRDWRTAIYRQMGHPELEDLLDGKKWLTEHEGVDPKRVGLYGGSYGGFMTLMALFRAPGEFAAGAALRPVTDWMQYDHNYTAAILNPPQIDPIAYRRSSPIEFAAGLEDSLLICHGVIDDNVLFEDSMRLYERLIELHKDKFTISPYPLDRHGFTNADSWLDEYKRIYRLFESRLQ
ncbi:MAG TPA: prolyl oligopeptidase family serine peptidase [Steroidobacteraceae bacterium]|jgi:dipeptidyl aminopeptidase/acylaminoacyl peptidase|nr:prolyl oligopeptidase family serine peptidase [Steroidobacteraceae bacterium]